MKINYEKYAEDFFERNPQSYSSPKNRIFLSGMLTQKFVYNYSTKRAKYYSSEIMVNRKDTAFDFLPIHICSPLLEDKNIGLNVEGKYAEIFGEVRTYNYIGEDEKSHVYLYVLVSDINVSDVPDKLSEQLDINLVALDGFVVKNKGLRVTPLGKHIDDLIIAVNKPCNESSYISSICFNTVAKYTSHLTVGDRVVAYGTLHSREYDKNGETHKIVEFYIINIHPVY